MGWAEYLGLSCQYLLETLWPRQFVRFNRIQNSWMAFTVNIFDSWSSSSHISLKWFGLETDDMLKPKVQSGSWSHYDRAAQVPRWPPPFSLPL